MRVGPILQDAPSSVSWGTCLPDEPASLQCHSPRADKWRVSAQLAPQEKRPPVTPKLQSWGKGVYKMAGDCLFSEFLGHAARLIVVGAPLVLRPSICDGSLRPFGLAVEGYSESGRSRACLGGT